MPLGELSAEQAGISTEAESRFAFGAGLSLGYDVWSGLIVGVAPQVITGTKPRDESQTAGNEFDLLARRGLPLLGSRRRRDLRRGLARLFALLPGPLQHQQGFVLAGGVGCEIDFSDHLYANVGLGYQKGWQTQTATANYRTSYVRVALGIGARF
jgi:hypothetical protein